ncbi:MAG: Gfo/Idh/MocA family oxidoreductase [Planctomycetes bacterium]|nr:Gfo/Idh/MocA family oxidoreductase [Planctomycetota bacterium]
MTARQIRCGILGPGRHRNGLGPFLARWFEHAGLEVSAVAGRDDARTREAAREFTDRFGHPVDARLGVDGLLAPGDLDVLVVASPHETHADAIRAGLEASVHVYCEKPIVTPARTDEIGALCRGFVERGLVLFENCQWPCFLPVFDAIWPDRPAVPALDVRMMLSPSGTGLDAVVDSLSHLLSVVQAVTPLHYDGTEVEVAFATRAETADANEVTLRFVGPAGELRARLTLERHESQPRPAWVEIDGRRVVREIRMADYAIFGSANGVRLEVDDPLAALVYRFADLVREPTNDRIQRESDRIHDRARFFRDVVAAW